MSNVSANTGEIPTLGIGIVACAMIVDVNLAFNIRR